MTITHARFGLASFVPAVLVSLASFCSPSVAHAQAPLVGKYQCVRIEAGNRSASCQSPPLILNRDGSYQIWGEHGTYEVVQGQWLVLSHSKRRGLGQVKDSHEIVFEYQINGHPCRVTFRRIFERPPGLSWS